MKSSIFPWILGFFVSLLIGTGPAKAQTNQNVPDHLQPKRSIDTPLEFVRISVEERTDTSLTITWTTNEPARGRIQFGRGEPEQESFRSSSRRQHTSFFEGLIPGTTYRFRIFAVPNSAHGIKSQVIETTTRGIPPPRIQKMEIVNRTMNGATLRWLTNLPVSMTLEAGHDTPPNFRTRRDTPSRYHQVHLTRFYPDQPLYYRLTLTDTRGHSRTFDTESFRTREANHAYKKPINGTFDQTIFGLDKTDTSSEKRNNRINDGNYSYAEGTANSGNPSDTDQYFTIDLEEFVKPGRAVFYWQDLAFPRRYEIEGSQTGRHWTTLKSRLDAGNGTHTLTPIKNTKSMKHVVTFPDTVPEYQFIRVTIPQGANYFTKYDVYEFVQLIEFKLFPDNIPHPAKNESNQRLTPSEPQMNRTSQRKPKSKEREGIPRTTIHDVEHP